MPRGTDLTVSNSIIQSYLAGQTLRRQKEQDAIAAQDRIRNQKIQDEQLQQERERLDLSKVITNLQVTKALQDMIGEGFTPPGYKDITPPPMLAKEPGKTRTLRREEPSNILPNVLEGETEEAKNARALKVRGQELQQNLDLFGNQEGIKSYFTKIEQDRNFIYDKLLQQNEFEVRREVARIQAGKAGKNFSPLAQKIMDNPELLYDKNFILNSTQRGLVMNELAELGFDFETSASRTATRVADRGLEVLNDILGINPGSSKVQTGLQATLFSQAPGTKAFNDAADIERLKVILTLPELSTLEGMGHLSDADREFLTSIGTKLSIGLPQQDFDREIARIKQIFDNAALSIRKKANAPTVTDSDLEDIYNKTITRESIRVVR